MKKFLRSLAVILLITSMFTLTTYANDFDWYKYPCVSPESVLLPPTEKRSTFTYQPNVRGSIIAAANLSISNEGKGVIGIYAQTLAYIPVDKCRMRIYLDRWYEDKQRWAMEDYWDITFVKEETGEELVAPTVSFDVTNQPSGYYYRLRGLHAVWLNGETEGFSTETDGVYITK